ncbi:sialidase-1-like isoform X3 [Cuculus canorus]|uniref:sialidase-1-like isoform X3 n=1 Tax=Cuculus canorus TaxID=55661 RepID=UPI0023AAE096|nr:sialidase-1-like isoform X3 [Cuculus canorus]
MNRRRRRLLGDPWGGGKRPRGEGPGGDPRPDGTPAAVEAALAAVAALFPRRLFGDALPPLVLRHQLYDLVPDRTAVDRHLNRLRDEGRVRLLHLGLGPDELAVVFMEPYREKVLAAVAGTPREGLVRRFLDTAVAASAALSYDEAQMRALGFEDRDITYGAVGGSGAADGARRRQLVVGAAGGREGRPRRAARPPGAVGADPPHSAPGAAAGAGFGGVAAPPGTEPGAALPSARPSGGAAPAQVRPRVVREQLLWVSGEGHGGVHTFRVPLVIVTPGGALLACAEGRKRSPDDVGAKVIACRRSPDRGATWGPTRVATDDGWSPDGLSLGALGVAGGDVLLLFARCAHPPQACGPPTTQLLRSRDDGRSWGAPQNLSGVLGSEVFAPGPGYGIQKRLPPARGRLLFCGHGTLERDGVRLLLSDDGGHSWRWGGTLPAIPFGAPRRPHDFTPDECQPYELPDGSVAVSIRNQNFYRCRCRMVARSWDGGASLPPSAVAFDPVLVDPAVAAGVLVTRGLVFFSNPAHESQRVNLTLRWSFTNGTTWWGRGLRVWEGPSGYSSMAAPPPSAQDSSPLLYLIYEKGRSQSTESVALATISIAGP